MSFESRAELVAADRLRDIRSASAFSMEHPLYLKAWQDNLIDGVTPLDVEYDLRHAAGNELTEGRGNPVKFCAARSSSALAANTFGPFRRCTKYLTLAGYDDFREAWLEKKCRNGLQTPVPPHLDFLAESIGAVVAVESKFLEPFGTPALAAFSEQYKVPFEGTERRPAITESPWTRMFNSLRESPDQYKHLNAAQLVKHYLGLIHSYGRKKRVLIYLYWEPQNGDSFDEIRKHRGEIKDFSERVAGCDTQFIALSYPALWQTWEATSQWSGMPDHITRLRNRYDFAM